MKKFLLSLVIALSFLSCEEIPPLINPIMGQGDCDGASISRVADQRRQVLIEEFTGIRCVNCPAGSDLIEDLLGIHGDQLIAVSIHAGDFAPPYKNESLYDFRTPEGSRIQSYLGPPIGYPSAVVNRKLYPGENDLQLGLSQWANAIDLEKAEAPKVKIAIDKVFDSSTRELSVEVSLFMQEDLSQEDLHLNVMITENDIQDYQLTPSGKEADYTHKHVFRTTLTVPEGNPIKEEATANARICKSYSTVLPDTWIAGNCRIVAFVSIAGEELDVLQAAESRILD